LEEYLETKRLAFPRFYFLSNDELLEILAQTKNPHAVQSHLRKCFDNIAKLEFTPEPKSVDIVAMVSAEGERVELGKNLKARNNVEIWLSAVESAMVSALRKIMKRAVIEYDKKRRQDWIMDYPSQIVLTASQIAWSQAISTCFKAYDPKIALMELRDTCVDQLNELAELVRGDLTPLKRGVLGALITIDVHSRGILKMWFTHSLQHRYCRELHSRWSYL
jgi:dynein heavy chain